MSILAGVLSLAAAWLLGSAWLSPVSHLSRPLHVGLAYGVGLAWISIAIGIVALLGLPITLVVVGPVILLPPISWALGHFRSGGIRSDRKPMTMFHAWSGLVGATRDPWWWSLLAATTLWGLVAARALLKPISTWDATTSHSLKAKAILVDAAVSPSVLQWIGFPDYPLGIPFQEVWIGWIVGEWHDIAVKLLFPGYLLALLVLVYAVLRDTCAPRAAMAGTLFVAGLPFLLQHGQVEYTDLPMAYFVVGHAAILTLYARSNRRTVLVLAAFFAVGILLVRADGPIVAAGGVALLVVWWARTGVLKRRSTWGELSVYLAPQLLVWGGWEFVKFQLGFAPSLPDQAAANISHLDRSLTIVKALIEAMFLQGNWLILWAMFFVAFIARFRDTLTTESLFLVWPVMTYLVGILILSEATGQYQFIVQETFLNRMVLHVAPLAALWVANVYAHAWNSTRSLGARAASQGRRS